MSFLSPEVPTLCEHIVVLFWQAQSMLHFLMLFYFGVSLVKQSGWRLLPAIPMAFLLPCRWKQSWYSASSLEACRNRLTASLSILFWPAKSCVAAASYQKSSCVVPKTLPKTGEKTSVGIRQKSDKYEPQWREEAEHHDLHPEGQRPCIPVAWVCSPVLSSDSISSQPEHLNPGGKIFFKILFA